MKETLGEYIERKRKELRLSQRALAKKAGISSSTLNRLEMDVGKPESGTLEKLADALKIPMSQLTDVLQGRTGKDTKHPAIRMFDQLPPHMQRIAEKMIKFLFEESRQQAKQ